MLSVVTVDGVLDSSNQQFYLIRALALQFEFVLETQQELSRPTIPDIQNILSVVSVLTTREEFYLLSLLNVLSWSLF